MRTRTKILAYGSFQHAHSVPVDDTDAIYRGQGGGVEKFVQMLESFFCTLADHV
jgi:hypothetical protein